MKLIARLMAFAAVAVLVGGFALAGDDITMNGGYVWEREDGAKEGALTAKFTPSGEGTWDVSFSFDWEDGPHICTGSCKGSLDGELSGDIVSDGDRKMNFKFNGAFKDGQFSGTHAFVNEDGTAKNSGTMTLAA